MNFVLIHTTVWFVTFLYSDNGERVQAGVEHFEDPILYCVCGIKIKCSESVKHVLFDEGLKDKKMTFQFYKYDVNSMCQHSHPKNINRCMNNLHNLSTKKKIQF